MHWSVYWSVYEEEMTPSIMMDLKNGKVHCEGCSLHPLKQTYMPLASLKSKVFELGSPQSFPFLKRAEGPDPRLTREWSFLRQFGVGFELDVQFYIHVLHGHNRNAFCNFINIDRKPFVIKAYQSIEEYFMKKDEGWLR